MLLLSDTDDEYDISSAVIDIVDVLAVLDRCLLVGVDIILDDDDDDDDDVLSTGIDDEEKSIIVRGYYYIMLY